MINSCYFIEKREREKREVLVRKDCRCLYTVLYRAFMITAYDVVDHYILAILCCRCRTDRIYYAVLYIQDLLSLCCAVHTGSVIIMLCCTYTNTGYIMLCHTYRIY